MIQMTEGRNPGKILYYDGQFTYLGSGDKGIKDGDIKVAGFNIPNHITLDKGNNLVFMDVDHLVTPQRTQINL